jgi:hypothetical protein
VVGVAGGGSAKAHDFSNLLLYVAAVGSCRARALGLGCMAYRASLVGLLL